MSCLLRIVAFASRAAYLLGAFHPSLVGIFLAFSNAGFGACVADMCLVTAVWCALAGCPGVYRCDWCH